MESIVTRKKLFLGLTGDFWWFWTGQVISNLGSSITTFVLPLLVLKITGSAIDLGIATAANFLPYLLFGLLIGAWTDRVKRRQMMIIVDLARAFIIALIPILWFFNVLSVWPIYLVGFANTVLSIFFNSGQFAGVPSLVEKDKLVTANGYISASFSTASVVGPFLAGLLIVLMPSQLFLWIDAASFVVSALTLAVIRTNFNTEARKKKTTILTDIKEGLVYVFRHPVLRNIAIMMALVNFFGGPRESQIVLLASNQLHADSTEIAWIYSAGTIGIVLLTGSAGFWRKHFSFNVVALGALILCGLCTFALAFTTIYWLALPLWAIIQGCIILFNLNNSSLRQAIVPNNMLGRVLSVSMVTAWSTIPLGALAGGAVTQAFNNFTTPVYAVMGVIFVVVPAFFAFTALGRADHYIELRKAEEAQEAAAKEQAEKEQQQEQLAALAETQEQPAAAELEQVEALEAQEQPISAATGGESA
ncbi:MAG TPA: MFS transporter [Ktedonobacteraceae bacterium]|jgi:MFS family permease|nr:MFS transporter [Ktedonobacteraceae bacterium]